METTGNTTTGNTKLAFSSSDNITKLSHIKDYINSHMTDFKQVFFKPEANSIKSERVGVYTKNIYGQNTVTPIQRVPGLHTADSCKLNTAIYANSKIDYNSPIKYKPGLNYTTVVGNFRNSPNYFLSATIIKKEKINPANYVQYDASDGRVSVEISGYIAAQNPGTYKVSMDGRILLKNVLIWIGNNAEKTYRKENAMFRIESNVITVNNTVKMVTGEYTPFRMQFSYRKGEIALSPINLLFNENQYPISVFAINETENNLYYYSLTPADQSSYYNCDIYSGSELEKNKAQGKSEEKQIQQVWSINIPEETSFVCLDMLGNLNAYDSQNNLLKTLKRAQNPNNRKSTIKDSYLFLLEDQADALYIQMIDKTVNKNSVVIPVRVSRYPITSIKTVKNDNWIQTPNAIIKMMSNKSEQYGDKKLSVDRITETISLFSENRKFKLAIIRNQNGQKVLALLVSLASPSVFYTAEPDLKMNKLFYGSTYIETKFLREVPDALKVKDKTYSVYQDTYPMPDGKYITTNHSDSNDCIKQCNSSVNCNYFYRVIDTTGTKCVFSTTPDDPITFLPKQPGSAYTSSELKIVNKKIQVADSKKNEIYNKAEYIPNGYAYNVEAGFKSYPVERKVLSETDMPGPEGVADIVELQNQINYSTSGAKKISVTNLNNPMIAGKIQGTKESFVVDNATQKINEIESKIKGYSANQSKIDPYRIAISNNITSINQTYVDMSNNNLKYDFTSKVDGVPIIYSLEEDRSLASALIKDNTTYLTEQNNLYMIVTVTMATLLVTSVLISR